MCNKDMTIEEMLHDPLIHRVLEADGTSHADFANLLREVSDKLQTASVTARVRKRRLSCVAA